MPHWMRRRPGSRDVSMNEPLWCGEIRAVALRCSARVGVLACATNRLGKISVAASSLAALGLAACTGSGGIGQSGTGISTTSGISTYTVGGTVSGLTGTGLVLQNNGGDSLKVTADGSFTFKTQLISGNPYLVTVSTQPDAPTQTCAVSNAAGTIANASVTNVSISCTTKTAAEDTIGGIVVGLAGSGLQLQDNAADTLAVSANGSFTFATPLASGTPYAVSVLSQPVNPNQNCLVTGGAGTTGASDVNNVAVSCTTTSTPTYTIGGTVSGLPAGETISLQDNGTDTLTVSNGSFTFATPVPSGNAYYVTLVPGSSPQSLSCAFTNASGIVPKSAVTNVTVVCNASAPASLVSMEVTSSSPNVAKGFSQQFTATGIYSGPTVQGVTNAATWTSSNPAVAAVSNSAGSKGLVTTLAVGQAIITATIGNVSASAPITVTPATLVAIQVTPTNPTVAKGFTKQLTATGIFSDNSTQNLTTQVTWSSSAPAVATINNTGLAATLNVGTSLLTAISGTISGSTTLSVTNAQLISIGVTPANASIAKGLTEQFTATGVYSDSSTQSLTAQVTWSSSAVGVATIASTGLATSVAPGPTTITATSGTVAGSTTLTVTNAQLVSINVTPANPSIANGLTQQFTATGLYTDNSQQTLTTQVVWSSSNTNVATISNASGSQGLATTEIVGQATVTATSGSISSSATLKVTAATLTSIMVTPANPTVANGLTEQFTATGHYTDSSTQNLTAQVTWSSSSTNIASISNAAGSQGLATTMAVGPTTITAMSGTISGSTTLTVGTGTLTSITVTPAAPTIANGLTQQFTATGHYTDGTMQNLTTQATWTSSLPNIAPISNAAGSQGVATAAAVGTTTITATSGTIPGSTTLTVGPGTLVYLVLAPANPMVAKGLMQQFTATGHYTDGTTQDLTSQATWSSSNTNVASIIGGLATALATGQTTIEAAVGTVTISTGMTVTPPTLTSIDVEPTGNPSIFLGTSESYVATGYYSDGSSQDLTTVATWTSSNTSVATISSPGVAISAGVGTTNISATSGGILSNLSTLTVTPAALVAIQQVTPATASITTGVTQQYTATGAYTDGSQQLLTTGVTWNSSLTDVATISATGLATGVAVGTTTITASAVSGVTGNPISGTASLTVTSASSYVVSVSITGLIPGEDSMNVGLTPYSGISGIDIGTDGIYSFPPIPNGSNYTVSVQIQPTALGETCSVTNGQGTLTGNVTVAIPCANNYGEWAWMDGSQSFNVAGVYGTVDVTSSGNSPGGRYYGVTWTDKQGNLWLFGGQGADSTGNQGLLNDLWEYPPANGYYVYPQWTWMGGSNIAGATPVYGTKGAATAANVPGARQAAVSWTDSAGNLWLFGGVGVDSASNVTALSDLWVYNTGTGFWKWVGGPNVGNAAGVYGTQGTAATSNWPGGRTAAVSWVDGSGNFWLFGGNGYDVNGNQSGLSDLWQYNPGKGYWTWMSGPKVVDQVGVYGTLGTAAAGNIPGARFNAVSWIDQTGNLWLLGGYALTSLQVGYGDFNDLWRYSPGSGLWTWMAGSNAADSGSTYGTKGTPAVGNAPGARDSCVAWTDKSGNFWLFGGQYVVSNANFNDLWEYSPASGLWTWQSGSDTPEAAGAFGTEGIASASGVAGARYSGMPWIDANGNLWLLGGAFYNQFGVNVLNDLWIYVPPAGQ